MKPSYLSCLYPHFSAQQNAVKGDNHEWLYVWTTLVSCPVAVMPDSGQRWSGSVSPTVRASTPPGQVSQIYFRKKESFFDFYKIILFGHLIRSNKGLFDKINPIPTKIIAKISCDCLKILIYSSISDKDTGKFKDMYKGQDDKGNLIIW